MQGVRGVSRWRALRSALALLVVLAAAGGAGPAAAQTAGVFADLRGHWAEPVAGALVQSGIIAGRGRFDPSDPVAFGDWALWLCAVLQWPQRPDCAVIQVAGPVSRAEALAAAAREAPTVYVAEPAVPTDVRAHRLESDLLRALRAGLVRGYPDATLQPDRSLTRAEAVVILGRLLVNRHEQGEWRLAPEEQTPLDRLRLRLHPELAGPHRYISVHGEDGRLIAARVRVAETRVQRMVGAESGLGEGLMLMDTGGIHTRWGPVPLDVAFLSATGKVVAVYAELPRGVVRYGEGAVTALELPGGSLARLGIKVGEQLQVAPAGD